MDVTTTDYQSHFDPECYMSTYHTGIDGGEEFSVFRHRCLHKIFTDGTVAGERLLDVGTGPNIVSMLSASRHVESIDLSDFAMQNINILKDWKEGKRDLVKESMEYEMKICNDGRSFKERNDELRNKVKNIYKIDVTKPNIFVEDLPQPDAKYDIITSSLCLESAAPSLEGYKKAVCNISKHLTCGGYIIVIGALQSTFYRVGDYKFPNPYLSKDDICTIFGNRGYTIVEFNLLSDFGMKKQADSYLTDCKDAFVMLARKN